MRVHAQPTQTVRLHARRRTQPHAMREHSHRRAPPSLDPRGPRPPSAASATAGLSEKEVGADGRQGEAELCHGRRGVGARIPRSDYGERVGATSYEREQGGREQGL